MKFEYWLSNIYIDNTKKNKLKRSGIDAKTLFYMKKMMNLKNYRY